ncbi:SGNH/GDSL hydrolase family protein [Actinoplanes sp. NPDC051851]|uniref:SGNH/GDSL hydrolase family protein n=1 Tax=Actinoplanes sp. NPDC051851 TaxID=3154753 RepID=UPI0034223B16
MGAAAVLATPAAATDSALFAGATGDRAAGVQARGVQAAGDQAGSWATAVTAAPSGTEVDLGGRTLRQVVHLSLGGRQPRIHFTNEYGPSPVRLGEVWTGLRAGDGTRRPVTFGGAVSVDLPAGGTLTSDPVVDLVLAAGQDLVISCYLPGPARVRTLNPRAYERNLVTTGNRAALPDAGPGSEIGQYLLLDGVSVRPEAPAPVVVAFGDSITCGASTRPGRNHRWPDLLAARARAEGLALGVLNAGISGNRLLTGPDLPLPDPAAPIPDGARSGPAGVRRFDRDVLARPGARAVITLLGVNDIGRMRATADLLIAGHREIIARARAAGLLVIGGTLLPFAGSTYDGPARQAARSRLNAWIRYGGEYDAVADFDAAVRDPRHPSRLPARYDSGDHLHPGDEGMAALASAVPLTIFGLLSR